jgi:hypothetical protein
MSLLGADGEPVNQTQPTPAPSPEPPAPQVVTTAFLVFQSPNGQWMATDDLGMAIVPSRPPSPDDIIGAAENIKTSLVAQKTASITVQTQVAFARQQAQAVPTPQEQALAARLMGGRR